MALVKKYNEDTRVAVQYCSMAVMLLMALLVVVSATFSPCQAATTDGDETRGVLSSETCVEDFYCGLLRCEASCLRWNLDPRSAYCKQHGKSAYCCCSHKV